MSYHLIGHLSALVCDDYVEPLPGAKISIFLPGSFCSESRKKVTKYTTRNTHFYPIKETDLVHNEDYLLAETTVGENGQFSLCWEELHLFTEPLEFTLSLKQIPGMSKPASKSMHFYLGRFTPQWTRNKGNYRGAFAYIVPGKNWSQVRAGFQNWIITGAINWEGTSQLAPGIRIEAFDKLSGKMISWGRTGDNGRFCLYYNPADIQYQGLRAIVSNNNIYLPAGPSVYFKCYDGNRLILSEHPDIATMRGRRDLSPCSRLNITLGNDANTYSDRSSTRNVNSTQKKKVLRYYKDMHLNISY